MTSFYSWFDARASANKRRQDAAEFLRTGVILGTFGGTKCYTSADCASGWNCINNTCVYPSQPGSSSQCDTGPSGSGGCGGSSGCGTVTAGTSCLASDCCGTRCCRYSAYTVNCYCGNCPDEPRSCNNFCDSYKKNTGNYSDGCSESNTCSECANCNSSGECSGYTGPCWCDATRSCELCQENGSWTSDPACWPCRNFTKCGVPTGEVYCSSGLNGSLALLQTVNGRPIDEPCDPGCIAENCTTHSVTVSGAGSTETSGSSLYPSCCPTCECTNTGFITVGNSTTYFIEECDKEDLPPDCCKVECNCHSECSDCERCNEYGTCVPDVNCTQEIPVAEYYPLSGTKTFTYEIGNTETALTYCHNGNQARAALGYTAVTSPTVTRSNLTGWKFVATTSDLHYLCNTFDSNVNNSTFLGFRVQFANGTTEDIGITNVQSGTTIRSYPTGSNLSTGQVSGTKTTIITMKSIS